MKLTRLAATIFLSVARSDASNPSLRRSAAAGAIKPSPSADTNNGSSISSRGVANSPVHFLCGNTYCLANRATCENDSVCQCLRGWGGPNCDEEQDECIEETYPCAGGDELSSFCVDYDPPYFYKCGCLPGRVALLPNQTDVADPVPASWRPLACVPVQDEDGEVADSLPSSSLTPSTAPQMEPSVVPTPSPTIEVDCTSDEDCARKGTNLECKASQCECQEGTVKVGPNCQNKNECLSPLENDCHKYATCIDLDPPHFYSCFCAKGYSDKYPAGMNKTGTVCEQENECLAGTHDCALEKTCLDRVPPVRWECIDPTPAPTNKPTPSPTAPRAVPIPASARLFTSLGANTYCGDPLTSSRAHADCIYNSSTAPAVCEDLCLSSATCLSYSVSIRYSYCYLQYTNTDFKGGSVCPFSSSNTGNNAYFLTGPSNNRDVVAISYDDYECFAP